MKRLIPGKTKVQVELFKGVMLGDIVVAAIGIAMLILILISSLPQKLIFCIVVIGIAALLLVRMDAVPNYRYLMQIITHYAYKRRYERVNDDELLKSRALGTEKDTKFERLFKKKPGSKGAPVTAKPSKKQKNEEKPAEKDAASGTDGKKSKKKAAKQEKSAESKAKEAKKAREAEDRLLKSASVSDEEKIGEIRVEFPASILAA